MNKRGEITIKYIIGFIIALIVLVAVILFFTGQFGIIGEKISNLILNIFAPIEAVELG